MEEKRERHQKQWAGNGILTVKAAYLDKNGEIEIREIPATPEDLRVYQEYTMNK